MKRHSLWTRMVSSTIGLVAPKAAMRFAANRAALSAYIGAGGSDHNREWRPTRKSADAILRTDASSLVARSRSLERNYVNVAGALQKITDNVIHTGIVPQFVHARSREQLTQLEADFAQWAKKNRFYVMQQPLALRHWWVDGELFGNQWIDPRRYKAGINPLRIEMLEQDLIDTAKDGVLPNGNVCRRGVEFDQYGDPVAYWVLDAHPGDYIYAATLQSTRVEASRMIHLWLPLRASQTRGVSRMAPIVEEIKDLSEYKANERIAARLASAFGIFIKSSFPDMLGQPSGGDPTVGEAIEPGMIRRLSPGTEIQVAEAKRPGSPYESYVKSSNKDASVGFGLRYGNYSHDYTESSYSSERSASMDERRGWIGQQQFLIAGWIAPIVLAWLRIHSATGLTTLRPEEVDVTFQCPGWPWVDPVKDANAAKIRLEMGVTSRRAICGETGTNYDDVVEQRNREKADFPEPTGAQQPA